MRRAALLPVVALLAVGPVPAANAGPAAANETFAVQFERDTVSVGHGVALRVAASDDDAVVVDSPNVTDARLERVVGGTPTDDGVRANVTDGTVRFRFDECGETGRYRFTVTGAETGATDDATLAVTAPQGIDPAFAENVVRVRPGGTARIGIDNDCARNATVRVGSRSAGFLANATLSLSQGHSTLRFDTNETASAGDPFAAGPNATLRNATLARSSTDEPLPPGEYDLTLVRDGNEKDAALLNVTGRAARATPTDAPPPTDTPVPPPTDTPTPVHPTPHTDPGSPTVTPTGVATDETGSPPTSTGGQPGFGVAVAAVSIILALYAGPRA